MYAKVRMLGFLFKCTGLLEILPQILRVSVSLVAFSFFSWCVVNDGLESSLIDLLKRPLADSREATWRNWLPACSFWRCETDNLAQNIFSFWK